MLEIKKSEQLQAQLEVDRAKPYPIEPATSNLKKAKLATLQAQEIYDKFKALVKLRKLEKTKYLYKNEGATEVLIYAEEIPILKRGFAFNEIMKTIRDCVEIGIPLRIVEEKSYRDYKELFSITMLKDFDLWQVLELTLDPPFKI